MPEQHRRSHAGRLMAAGVAVLLLGLGALVVETGDLVRNPPRVLGDRIGGIGRSGQPARPEAKGFAIAGQVGDLAPGSPRQLLLALSHRNDFPITVTGVDVAVLDGGPGCPGNLLVVAPFRGPVDVPADGSATTTLDVTLSPAAPDACQAAAWPLTYSGTAVTR